MSVSGSFLINTDDVGEAEAAIGANFGKVHIGVSHRDAPTRTRVWRTELNGLAVDDAEYTYDMTYVMDPTDAIMLCRIRSGAMENERRCGEVVAIGPGEVTAFGAVEGVPFSGSVHAAVYDLIVIDRQSLSRVAGAPGQPVRLMDSAPLSPAANTLLVDAIDYVKHGVLANAHAASSPLLSGALTDYLVTAVASGFQMEMPEVRSLVRRPQSSEVLVRRAVAFIDDNAHTQISAADIAAAANLPPHVLEMMFVQQQGCSPMQYVRRVRLNHAHHDLVEADPSTTTVGDVSRRWGFSSSSRFAIAYRLAYGRSPAATLRTGSSRGTPH
jgi:AraC-like DNA-binding protein